MAGKGKDELSDSPDEEPAGDIVHNADDILDGIFHLFKVLAVYYQLSRYYRTA